MDLNENKENIESKKPESKQWKAWEKNLLAGAICFTVGLTAPIAVGMNAKSSTKSYQTKKIEELQEENRSLKKQLENQKEKTVAVPVATASVKPSKEAAPVTDLPAEEPAKAIDVPATEATEAPADTYDHNQYYDIVEQSIFKDSINYSHLVYKVLAKKDVTVSATILAYGEDGNVIGKDSDEIVLTAGQYNFFQFSFESDISTATAQTTVQPKKDSIFTGARNPNAVEMVQYNQSGNELYITFKQNVDELDHYAKFKILFYKGDLIVDTDDGYFSSHAENLNGNGATDVVEVWAYGIDFDRIEYIYEP